MNDNDVHMIEDDESYASSNLSGFSSCSEKFEDLPDGLTEEEYVAEMMRRDAYYAERRIRKNRERGIEQQQRSGNSAGIAASQDGEGSHRRDGEHQQPSDEMDVESNSSIESLSPEGLRDAAMERQRREYIRLQEAHLRLLLMARGRLQQQQQEMKDDVSQHEPNENEDDEYGMGEHPKEQQEVHSHNEESSDGSNVPKGAYKRQIEEYEWLQRKHRQKTQSSTASASPSAGVSGSQHGVGSCPSSNYAQATSQSGSDFNPEAEYTKDQELFDQTAGSKYGSAKYANKEEDEEKDSKMPSEPRYYVATTLQNGDNTVPVTCTHCNGNVYRHSNQYGTYICEICRGLLREV